MKLNTAIAASNVNDRASDLVAAKKPFSVKTSVRAGLRGRIGILHCQTG